MKVMPKPAVMLASDYQPDDLVWFRTNSTEYCVFTVDPTFSLGKFDVTPITYRNLLLASRKMVHSQFAMDPPSFITIRHFRHTYSLLQA